MLAAYQMPGVLYERADAASGIAGVRMDVAAFVGLAERGPVGTPVPIESWRQFQAWFGDPLPFAFLAFAVRGFFENGGGRCWVVRVVPAVPDVASAGLDVPGESGAPAWRIEASSPGAWGDGLRVGLRRTHRRQAVARRLSPRAAWVDETGGFERGTLVRIEQPQPPGPPLVMYRVLGLVDPAAGRLDWAPDAAEAASRYDEAVPGLLDGVPGTVVSVEYDLVVYARGRAVAVYGSLSAVPEHARYGPRVLEPPPAPDDAGVARVPSAPPLVRLVDLRPGFAPATGLVAVRPALVPTDSAGPLRGGADLLARLTPDDFIGIEPVRDGSEQSRGTGIEAALGVDEVSLLSVPDLHVQPRLHPPRDILPECPRDPCPVAPEPAFEPHAPERPRVQDQPAVLDPSQVQRVQGHLVTRCEQRGDVIALLEPPASVGLDATGAIEPVRAWRGRFDTSHAALYHPWLVVLDPAPQAGGVVAIPPTGHVAGQIVRATLDRGIHQPGANRPLTWAHATTVPVSPAAHGLLNAEGINVIRPLDARGIRVLGARTMSSDTSFRFITVRRLTQMITKALVLGTRWAVFEPNDRLTRDKLRLLIVGYLLTLYERGLFAGASPEAAFQVRCDENLNAPAARDRGQLLAEVRFAPVVPLEFVVVRVFDVGGELETADASERGAIAR
jgi:hypothetical protein